MVYNNRRQVRGCLGGGRTCKKGTAGTTGEEGHLFCLSSLLPKLSRLSTLGAVYYMSISLQGSFFLKCAV